MKTHFDNSGSGKAPLMLIAAMLMACGSANDPENAAGVTSTAPAAMSFTNQSVRSNAEYLATAPYAGADISWGERQALQCRACHTLEVGGAQLLGPNLGGLFGRPVAVLQNYDYSPVLARADFVWTPDALDAWLAEPARFLPGNRMVFAGMRNKSDRDALIAYLLRMTEPDDTASRE